MTQFVLSGLDAARQHLRPFRSVWMLIGIIITVIGVLDPTRFTGVIRIAVDAFMGTLPYIAIAVLLIAYLRAAGAEAVIGRAFEGREVRMIFFAALFGGLAPFCSCEVIPFIAGLLAVGAPLSAIMAFWLSSPLIDPPTILITAGALGWDFAIGKTVSAIALGLLGGFGTRFLIGAGMFRSAVASGSRPGCCSGTPASISGAPIWRVWMDSERMQVFWAQLLESASFLIKWLALAYILEAVLVTYVPADFVAGLVGGEGFWATVTGALVGAPAYLNGYAAPALVSGLMDQGMGSGAAMAFMVSGAVSCIPAMAAVWSLVSRPVFFAYVGFGVGGAVLCGLVFGMFS